MADYSKLSNEELIGQIRMRQQKKAQPTLSAQPTMASDITSLLEKLGTSNVMQRRGPIAESVHILGRGLQGKDPIKEEDISSDLSKVVMTEGIKRALPESLEDKSQRELMESQTNFYRRAFNDLKDPDDGNNLSTIEGMSSEIGAEPEDLVMTPEIRSIRGIPTQMTTPKLKPLLEDKPTSQIQELRSMDKNLVNNLKMITPQVRKFMNPLDPRASRGGIGQTLLKAQSFIDPDSGAGEFITFKAETDKMFQEFRKDTTGAQAALKELGWLSPDFPEPNDPPEVYIQKASEALVRIQEGEKLLLDLYGQRGYRVGEFRKGSTYKNRPAFRTEADAEASGYKGPVIIAGREAVIE